jgi:ferredoxin
MIIAEQKAFEEIETRLAPFTRVLVLGCKGCVTVCSAGGAKEVGILATALKLARAEHGLPIDVRELTVERQCDPEYLEPVALKAGDAQVILSMACGAGVQLTAERVLKLPVLPAVNTVFIGVAEKAGTYAERCQACGDCKLAATGGICPVARCSKSIMNGPCGGSTRGKCEISSDVPCGWQLIIDRLEALGRMDLYDEIMDEADWSTSRDGGPRRIVREELE